MIRRLVVSALAVLLLGAPASSSAAPPARVPRVGILCAACPLVSVSSSIQPETTALMGALTETGYVDGRTMLVDPRGVGVGYRRLAQVAADLVRRKVDVILAAESLAAAQAARQATSQIPIVMVGAPDAVELGLIQSLARPGGNLTGVTVPLSDLAAKQLSLLREVVPTLSRVAIVWNPDNPEHAYALGVIRGVAAGLRVAMRAFEVRDDPRSVEAVVTALGRDTPGGVLVLTEPQTSQRELQMFAIRQRLPTIFFGRRFAAGGGLIAYGPSGPDMYRQAGTFVGKILRGARPADLPAEQPDRYELVVNLTTARALGLSIPASVLARADEVIE